MNKAHFVNNLKAIRQDGLFALVQKNAGCDAGASYPAYFCLSALLLHPLHNKINQPLNIINIQ